MYISILLSRQRSYENLWCFCLKPTLLWLTKWQRYSPRKRSWQSWYRPIQMHRVIVISTQVRHIYHQVSVMSCEQFNCTFSARSVCLPLFQTTPVSCVVIWLKGWPLLALFSFPLSLLVYYKGCLLILRCLEGKSPDSRENMQSCWCACSLSTRWRDRHTGRECWVTGNSDCQSSSLNIS